MASSKIRRRRGRRSIGHQGRSLAVGQVIQRYASTHRRLIGKVALGGTTAPRQARPPFHQDGEDPMALRCSTLPAAPGARIPGSDLVRMAGQLAQVLRWTAGAPGHATDQGAKLHEKDRRVDDVGDTPPRLTRNPFRRGTRRSGRRLVEGAGADEVGEADSRYSPYDAGHPQRQFVDAE